jgi:hypothetical protein
MASSWFRGRLGSGHGGEHEREKRWCTQPGSCRSQVQVQGEFAGSIRMGIWREKRANIDVTDDNRSHLTLLTNDDALTCNPRSTLHNDWHMLVGTLPVLLEVLVSSANLDAAKSMRPNVRAASHLKLMLQKSISNKNICRVPSHLGNCCIFKRAPQTCGRCECSVCCCC